MRVRSYVPREENYTTIEKKCLAIVRAIKKFKSLVYIQAKRFDNKRIMRWSMMLQDYRFRLVSVKVRYNVTADYMSRM